MSDQNVSPYPEGPNSEVIVAGPSRGRRLLHRSMALFLWFLLALMLGLLLLSGWLLGSRTGMETALGLLDRVAPGAVQVEEVAGRLLGPLQLSNVQVDLPGLKGTLEGVELEWQPSQLFSGVAAISSLKLTGVSLRVLPTEDPDELKTSFELPDSLEAPIDMQIADLQLANVQIYVQSETGGSQIKIDNATAGASWIDTQIEVWRLSADGPLFDLEADAEVDARDFYRLTANAQLTARLPDYAPLIATLNLAGDVEESQLAVDVHEPYNLALAMTLEQLLQDFTIDAELTAKPQKLSILSSTLPPTAPSLRATAVGSIDDLKFKIDADTTYSGQHYVAVAKGTGKPTGLNVESFELNTDAGKLYGNASADWVANLTARVSVDGKKFNPQVYVPDLPGELDARLRFDMVQSASGELTANLSELNLAGELLGLPVNATGVASLSGETLSAKNLVLALGNNRLNIDGGIGKRSNFKWSLDLAEIEQFSALAGVALDGAITGNGSFEGAIADPLINARFSANELLIDGQRLDVLEFLIEGSRRDHAYQLLVDASQAGIQLAGTGDFQEDERWRYELDELSITHADLDSASVHHEWKLQEITGGVVAAEGFSAQPLCLLHSRPLDGGAACLSAAKERAGELQVNIELAKLQLDELNSLLGDTVRVKGELGGDILWSGALEHSTAQLNLSGLTVALKDRDGWRDTLKFGSGSLNLAPEETGLLSFDMDLPLAGGPESNGLFVDAQLTPDAGLTVESWPLTARMAVELPDMSWLAAFSDRLDEVDASLSGTLTAGGTPGEPIFGGATLFSVPKLAVDELGIELLDTTIELAAENNQLVLKGASQSGEGEVQLAGTVDWIDGLKVEGAISGENFTLSDVHLARAAVSPDLQMSFTDNKLKLRGEVSVPLADIRLAKIPDGAISASSDQRFVEEEDASVPVDLDARVRVKLGDDVRFTGLGLAAQFGGELTVSDQSTGTTTGEGEILIKEGTYKAYGQDLSVENGKLIFAGGSIDAPGLDIRAARQATPDVQVGVQVQGSLENPTLDVFSTPSLPQSDQLSYLVLGRPLSASSASENSILQQAAFAIGVEGGTLLTDRVGKNLGVDTFTIESAPGTGAAQAALVVGKFLSPRLYVSYGYGLFEPISTLRMEYQLNDILRVVTQSTNEATGGDVFWVRER